MIDYVNAGLIADGSAHDRHRECGRRGRSADVGRLEPGKAADIVALSRSPLEDIKAVMDVGFVMRDGIVFKGPGAVE